MSYYTAIINKYPGITQGDFTLSDNSDGKGIFISKWNVAKFGTQPNISDLTTAATYYEQLSVAKANRAANYPPHTDQLAAIITHIQSTPNTVAPALQAIITQIQNVNSTYPLPTKPTGVS